MSWHQGLKGITLTFGAFLAVMLLLGCSGGSRTVVIAQPTPPPTVMIQASPPVSSPTAVATTTATQPVVTAEQKAAWLKKVDTAIELLTTLSQPGVLRTKLDKAKYLGVRDLTNIDLVQDEINGRITLEYLLGKSADPDLNQYRGTPGSDPPPVGGYLAAIKAAIQANQFQTIRGTSPTDPVKVLGTERLLQRAIQTLQGYLDTRYQRQMPTEQTRVKFDTKVTQLGVMDLPGWSDAYFLLVEIQRELEPQLLAH